LYESDHGRNSERLEVEVGEVVTLLGTDSGQNISADDLATKCQTINYEIVTRINPNLSRLIV